MHHVEVEGRLEVADKFGRDNHQLMEAFKFPDNIRNFDDLEFVSIQSKYKDFVSQMNIVGAQKTNLIKVDEFDKLKIEDIIRTLNLPNDGTTGMHPIAKVFMDAYLSRTVDIADKFGDLNSFRNGVLKSVKAKSDIENFIKPQELKLRGTAYTTYDETRKTVFMLLKSAY